MKVYVGTSGYSFKEWRGTFYPEKIAASDMLAYYAGRLHGVEINNTFYRMPKREVVRSWGEQVHDEFRFVLKASRRITHFKKMRDTSSELEFLYSSARELGPKLGAVLFQFPPTLKGDLDLLEAFLADLPDDHRAAFEFRNRGWDTDEVRARLAARGCAWCTSDSEGGATDRGPADSLVRTATHGYARLRREEYSDEQLEAVAVRARELALEELFVFFKHEDAGPEYARRLQRRFQA